MVNHNCLAATLGLPHRRPAGNHRTAYPSGGHDVCAKRPLRGGGRTTNPAPHDILHYAGLTIVIPERRVTLHGRPLALTPTEFRLLATLASAPGHLFTYCDLAERVLGYTCAEREAKTILQTHVKNLRRKLGDAAAAAVYITAVRGVGYRLARDGAG